MDTRSGSGRRRAVRLVIIATTLAAGLAACSSGGGTASSTSGGAKAVAPAGAGNEAAAPNQAAPDQKSGAGTARGAASLPLQVAGERSIVYTGTMTVRVSNVDSAATQVASFATGSGGYVGGDQRSTTGGHSTATLTLRVPVDQFYAVVNQIGKLSKGPQDRQISAEDVTAKLIDLTSRVKTQQASVDRIRALMDKATSISDVTALESELSSREADLESLEAQQRDTSNLAALSTITVTLVPPDAPVPAPPKPQGGFLGGLAAGWHAFTASLRGVLTVLGAVLPFAAIAVPVWLLVVYVLRRRRPHPLPATESAPAPASDGR